MLLAESLYSFFVFFGSFFIAFPIFSWFLKTHFKNHEKTMKRLSKKSSTVRKPQKSQLLPMSTNFHLYRIHAITLFWPTTKVQHKSSFWAYFYFFHWAQRGTFGKMTSVLSYKTILLLISPNQISWHHVCFSGLSLYIYVKFYWPTRLRPNRWTLFFTHGVRTSVRYKKQKRATTLTLRPGKQNTLYDGHNYAWK